MARTTIPLPLDELAAICRRYNIIRLEVFGSILRDDFGPDSDVDFIFTLAPGAPRLTSHWLVYDVQQEIEDLLRRRTDFMSRETAENIRNPYRRKAILESAEVLLDLAQAA